MSDHLDAFTGICGSQEYLGSSGAVGSMVKEGKTDKSNEIVDAAANPGDGADSMLGSLFSNSDNSQEQYGQSEDFLSP
eukprot:15251076-Ditylum_brightwellii.AAC.1